MPRNTWPGFCCSPMYAVTTTRVPVSAGMAHWSSFICRCEEATLAGVWWFGSVAPLTDGPPAFSSRMPINRL